MGSSRDPGRGGGCVDACFLTLGSPSPLQGREGKETYSLSLADRARFPRGTGAPSCPALPCPAVSVMPLASEAWVRHPGLCDSRTFGQQFTPTLGCSPGSWFVASPGPEGRRVAACLSGVTPTFCHTFISPCTYLALGRRPGCALLQRQDVLGA